MSTQVEARLARTLSRYQPAEYGTMRSTPDGAWVRYADVVALLAAWLDGWGTTPPPDAQDRAALLDGQDHIDAAA